MTYRLGVRATLVLLVLVFVVPILGLVVQTSVWEQESALETARVRLRVQAQLRAENQKAAVRELASVQAQLDALSVPPGVTDVITDAQGIVVASAGERPQRMGVPPSDQFLSQAVRSRRAVLDKAMDNHGQQWLYATQPVNADGAGGLVVASFVSIDSILGPAILRLQKELVILLGITLAAALLAWYLGDRLLAEPIERILAKVRALEHGEAAPVQPSIAAGPQVRELTQIDRGIDDLAEAMQARRVQRDQAMAEIQAQKRAMEASEQRYRAHFEASPQPMWVFDTATLAFLVVNDAAVMHYGYTREEFMRMTLADIRPPEDIPLLMATLAQHQANPVTEILRRHRRKSGEIIDVEIATHSLDWDGRPARMMIVYDVTSRELARLAWKRLHETLERKVAQRTRELELANEELEAFSYSVSHDLRAPLQVMDGFCGFLAERYKDELPAQASHYVERIRAGSRQMNTLIEDLLSLARTGRAAIEHQPVDLASIASKTVAQLRQRFPDRQVNVQIDEPMRAHCDRNLIAVLLDNLIGNAWKFTSRTPQATIRIGVASTPNGPAFCVADNGAGFDMAFSNKLFKAFHRLHSASEFEGTGIGLAIVYRIIHRHGGSVWAESEVGKGASFFFTLPEGPAGAA